MLQGKDLKFNRILSIYQRLIEGRVLNKQQLALEFGVSEKSIQRDIEHLNIYLGEQTERADLMIKYSRKQGGYILENAEQYHLRREDIFAIIKVMLGTRAFNQKEMNDLINMLLKQMDQSNQKMIKELIGNELLNYVPLQHNEELLTKVWEFSEIIQRRQVIEMSYTREDFITIKRYLQPVGIIFSEYYFYLIAYMEELKKQVIHWDAIKEMGKELKIVYSPLHGTGNIPARRILKELGFENVYVVKEQELPDGEFPTVSYPNPEAEEAFELGLKLAKEVDADLVLATDPDADRLGVYVKDSKSGEYKVLTGNMSGCLLADYEIGQRKATVGLPEDGYLIKTIVTSNMADAIAKGYGTGLIEVLTGFKFIGQQILGFEQSKKGTYLFGFEESYGCLIGTHARDKDAIVATMALCEAAAYYKTKGMTLWDAMVDMYERFGYYKDDIQAITLKGIEGLAKIQEILETLRKEPPVKIGAYEVLKARDYQADTIKDLATGEVTGTGLPNSNVLYYDLTDDAWLCVRPSGTEPKVKFYYGVKGTSIEDADAKSEALGKEVLAMIDKML